MKIKLITVILVICCIIKLLHKQKGINVEDWSDYQGIMTWEESNEKCEGLQMRPPTRKEIKAAYNANLTDSWKKDGFLRPQGSFPLLGWMTKIVAL
jgi:hypothetical protein